MDESLKRNGTRSPPLILVVDDDSGTRLLASTSLGKAGFATVEAADGVDGIAAFERFRPDLILLDVMMPRMDGFSACLEIRKRPGGDRIPILMMTGLADLASIHRAYEVGATDFVTKPINWVVLGYRVSYLMRASHAFLDLANSEEKTWALMRAIPDLIFRIGADGTVLDLVAGEESGAHPSMERWAGRKLSEMIPGEAAEEAFRHTEQARMTGSIQVFEYDQASGVESRSFEARVVSIPNGESLFIARDITDRKKAEERLAYLAYHDSLTGLPNRVTFKERLVLDLARAKRRAEVVGVVLVDLDRFKEVNDTLGHESGDKLLVAVAQRLQETVRDTDTVSRMSGDEFCVILPDQKDGHAAVEAARRIRFALVTPFDIGGQEIHLTASMGLSLFPFNGDAPEILVKNADIAMFRAKALGRDTLQVFSEEMSAAVEERARMEKGLRRASERNEFVVHYQPEIDLKTGLIVGAEALVRWQTPDKGLVPPMQFIPVAEETGAIIPMSEWVIQTACAQAKEWHKEGYEPFRISINVSARLFQQYDLAKTVLDILRRTGLEPESLELEITESVAMQNIEAIMETLWKLNGFSIRVAMDDFGTGYSSLAYLKKFPINILKIDMAFIKDLDRNPEDQTIVKAIIAMAHTLKIDVIAEGVERPEQVDLLKAFGCGYAQGFYFSKPLPAREFTKLLSRNRGITA
ncbi:MAG TPA: EAL domain-containing protein [Candidatus Deferrimicrobiaceae bacterium]|jgi:diguanylate cyclase (GGDEF)-like protein|nr:EAL domain-containing protein [Candidatus Deferrimicrobiaceae bacterium]